VFARVTELRGMSEPEMSRNLRFFESEILPKAEQIEGMSGGFVFVDRENGCASVITLWADQEMLEQSREQADALRDLAFQQMNFTSPPSVREYEVAIARLLTTIGAPSSAK
jgi:ribosomal protein L29